MRLAWSRPSSDKFLCVLQSPSAKFAGSPVPGKNDEARMFVPAGLIGEGGESLEVIHHIWVDSRAPWDEIGDSGKQHRGAFEG